MKQTIEMIMMTLTFILMALFAGSMLTACSTDDDNSRENTFIIDPVEGELFGMVVEPGKQLIDILPSDWALTFEDIVAYNPDTRLMKVRKNERTAKIAARAYPIPTQYRLDLYLNDHKLFGALLNSTISSFSGGTGLMCYFAIGNDAYDYYYLSQNVVKDNQGNVTEGELTEVEKAGLRTFEQLLSDHGKCDKSLDWGTDYVMSSK